MTLDKILLLIILSIAALALVSFFMTATIAIYLQEVRPHLLEIRAQKRKARITGVRLVVDREPSPKEAAQQYRYQ